MPSMAGILVDGKEVGQKCKSYLKKNSEIVGSTSTKSRITEVLRPHNLASMNKDSQCTPT